MRALITGNHFSPYAGASIVAVEVAQYFQSLSYDVEICTGYIAPPLLDYIQQLNIPFRTLDDPQNPNDFDVIWSQQHILPAMLYKHNVELSDAVKVISVSLSGFVPTQLPGAIVDMSTVVVANSLETADNLVNYGINKEKIHNFKNAAPAIFNVDKKHSSRLNKILVVSNHIVDELKEASALLKNIDINVDFIGLDYCEALITPSLLQGYDAVITIGKTVQYCILSETPVYVYDYFGGPGWLNDKNFEKAAYYNFSGRCCKKQLSPQEIVDDLLSGYANAVSMSKQIKKAYGHEFSLEVQMEKILSYSLSERKNNNMLIKREGGLALEAANNYASLQRHMIDLHSAKVKINDLLTIIRKFYNDDSIE